jgi:chromosome segregation ATPase
MLIASLKAEVAALTASLASEKSKVEDQHNVIIELGAKLNATRLREEGALAEVASVTHELEETKRWLQEEGARGNTCRAENAALAKEIERNKYEFEVSHRVVQAHKQAEQNAVRIGCENITAREKAEASLAELRKRMRREESCICTRIPSKNWHLDKCPAALASPPSPAPVESKPCAHHARLYPCGKEGCAECVVVPFPKEGA